MKISKSVKGYLFALVSVIAVSNVYIFSKAALEEVSFSQFGTYWFTFGLIWILIYGCSKKSYRSLEKSTHKKYKILIFLGIIEVVGTYFFFKAINTMTNPTIVSFIGNISPVFIISLSYILLKERFNSIELVGMVLVIVGAFVISYKVNANFSEMFLDGTQYVLYSSILGAIGLVIIKKNIKNINPIILTTNRSLFLLFFSIIVLVYTQQSIFITTSALIKIIIGSLLGPFLTVISGYLALQYIPLSRRAIVSSTKGIFVLIGSYLYFGEFPKIIALIGGIITVFGVLLIAFGNLKLIKSN